MTTLPAANAWSNAANEGVAKQIVEDILARLREHPGFQAESGLTIASGAVTPTGGIHTVDTEGAAAADDLTHIVQDNHPDGSLVVIRATDPARVVTAKHAAGGAGQLLLHDSADFVLNSTKKWLILKRTDTSWEEFDRSGVAWRAGVVAKTSGFTAGAADAGALWALSNAFTLAFDAAATLGNGWAVDLINAGTGIVTLDPNGSETVDGFTTLKMYPGERFRIACNGTAFYTIGRAATVVTHSGTLSAASAAVFGDLDAAFREYEITLSGFLAATDQVNLIGELSTDNGSSWDQGASDYDDAARRQNSTPTGSDIGFSPGSALSLIRNSLAGNAAGETVSGKVTIVDPMAATRTAVNWHLQHRNETGSFNMIVGGGQRLASSQHNAFRLRFSSGNIASGGYTVRGLRAQAQA